MTRSLVLRCAATAPLVLFASACSPDERVAPLDPACRVELGSGPGYFRLTGRGTCAADVTFRTRVATGDPDAPTWSDANEVLRVEGTLELDGNLVRRRLAVHNDGAEPVTLLGLELRTDGETGLSADRFLHNGYQSWSYTGVEPIPASPLPEILGTAPNGGGDGDVLGEQYGVSWWWTFVSDPAGHGLVVGADGGTVLKTYVAVDRAPGLRVRVIMGMTGDRLVLGPGESRELDAIVVALGDVDEQLERMTESVAAAHPPAQPRKPALGGWGSWNLYYDAITAGAMREEAAWATTELVPRGLGDFLLDDGYEPHWGDWRADASFGAELDTLASEQTAAGLSPAIWMAPFYVDVTDPDFAAHPDWFVRGDDGEPRLYDNFGPKYAALEVTVPAARERAVASVRALRDAGYRSLKLDFLFGGALEGVREPQLTSLEAYALWMRTLREAVPNVHIVGCGAPILPSVGWVDSMRVGPDIAFTLLPEPRWDFIASEARHTAYRAVTDRFWALDPDVVLLRGDEIDDAEAWTHVVSAAMAGGNYLLGDGRQAPAVRTAMAVDPEILAMARSGGAARPLDVAAVIDDVQPRSPALLGGRPVAVPHVWRKTSADGSRTWVAVFAWEEDRYVSELDLPEITSELLPPTGTEAVDRVGGDWSAPVTVPRHGVRLFTYR